MTPFAVPKGVHVLQRLNFGWDCISGGTDKFDTAIWSGLILPGAVQPSVETSGSGVPIWPSSRIAGTTVRTAATIKTTIVDRDRLLNIAWFILCEGENMNTVSSKAKSQPTCRSCIPPNLIS